MKNLKNNLQKLFIMLTIIIFLSVGLFGVIYAITQDYKMIFIFLGGSIFIKFSYNMLKYINLKF